LAVVLSASLLVPSVLLASCSPLAGLLASSLGGNWASAFSISGLDTAGAGEMLGELFVAAAAVTEAAMAVAIVERNCDAATAATVAESHSDAAADEPGGEDEDDEDEDDDADEEDVEASRDEDDEVGDALAAADCDSSNSWL